MTRGLCLLRVVASTAVLGAALWSSAAAAAPCAAVTAGAELPAAWQQAAASLADDAGVDCAGATVVVTARNNHVRVAVTSADGRRTEREAATPSELAAVVAGVVAAIPAEAEPEIPASAEVLPPIGPRLAGPHVPTPRAPEDHATDRHASPFTLGATFGMRVGLPTGVLSTEVELRGDVSLGRRWIASLSGRTAPAGARVRGTDATAWEYQELSLGALGGCWFPIGEGVLTTTVGPRAGLVSRETDNGTTHRNEIWVQAAARVVIPVGDRRRPAVSLEVEGAPGPLLSLASTRAFPSWSSSLRFGVVGDVP